MLDVVRKACLPAVWSQGAKLAREGSVIRSGENEYRVRAPGLAIAPTVTLYPDTGEWTCDCAGKVDPCAHVAAAAIADAQGFALSPAAPTDGGVAHEPAHVAYRFVVRDRRLALTRVLVAGDGREERLVGSLGSLVARGKVPYGIAPTHDDLRMDRTFGDTTKDTVPLGRMTEVLDAASAGRVTLDGAPARTSGEQIRPRAVIEDGANGVFTVRIERDPRVSDVVAMGVVRVNGVLHPIAEGDLTGEWLEHLPIVRSVSSLADLVTKVLPDLEKKLEVDVRTKRIPRANRGARPRIALDTSHQGHALSVLPTLVYGDPAIARVDGDKLVVLGAEIPERRRDEEKTLLLRLRDELDLVPGRRVDFDGADAVRFAAKLRAWQGIEGEAILGAAKALVPRFVVEGDTFDVVFESDPDEAATDGDDEGGPKKSGAKRADGMAVLRAFREGLDLVPLDGGGWAPLPRDFLVKHGARIADLFAARDAEKKLARAALPELGELFKALDAAPPFAAQKLAPLVEGFEKIPEVAPPDDLRASLRAYQREGISWLSFLRDAELGAVLADDMGLGKTLQTLAVLRPRGRTLVVCPKSVVYNWADEVARFRPSLKVAVYHGEDREIDPTAAITLTTYAVLRLDVERLEKEPWDVVVLDEAQAIKNESSQSARAAFRLKAPFRVALSGTPVENRLEELWSVMNFANPGLLGGRSSFYERYASPIGSGDADAVARLRAKIRPFVLRRMKRDVLPELPPRTDVLLHVELDPAERAVYDAVRAATLKDVADKLAQGGGVLAALEALLRLRQAACHPSLVPGQKAEGSSKLERLMEALEEAASDGHKALVFSQWTSLLDLVEPHLRAANIRFTRLDGSTKDRGAVVTEFQDQDGPPVMLVSLKAGGTGLNLTAADHVFLLDPWWNPAVEDQAADRAHRIGQDRPVLVHRLVAKDTVEERILALKEKKRALADAALGGAAVAASGITREDLLALLQ